ncbi:MAG: AMP-binding protein, partial [Gammaproteobacteria bacterium]|nr:AMP-binding protein [Gammaproteobacteria bacterium]
MVELDTITKERLDTDIKEAPLQPSTVESPSDLDRFVVAADGDNSIRWSAGERLHHLFERRCDQFEWTGETTHLAIDSEEASLTYGELDRRANRLARYLIRQGFGAGDIIGLLFDQSVQIYVSLLAVLKINAAYVPLDVGFPLDRIRYIAEDASIETILTLSASAD